MYGSASSKPARIQPATKMSTTVVLIYSKICQIALPNLTLHAVLLPTVPLHFDSPCLSKHKPGHQGVTVHKRAWDAGCDCVDYMLHVGLNPLSSTQVDATFNGFH